VLSVNPQAQRDSKKRYRSGTWAARFLPLLLLAVGLRQEGHTVRAAEALPQSQTDESSYYENACTIIDLSLTELLADFPELKGLSPAAAEALPAILNKVGTSVELLYHDLPSIVAGEEITQEHLRYDGRVISTIHHQFDYLIVINHDGPADTLQEYRTDARVKPVESTGVIQGFSFTKDFASMWLLFYPSNRSETDFRYLGRQTSDGRDFYVVAFAQRPNATTVEGRVSAQGRSALLLYQGLAWIDGANFRITRMRLDLLEPRLEVALERLTTEIQFGTVRLPQAAAAFWLPQKVTVTSICNGEMYRNQHLYSNFRLFTVRSEIKPAKLEPPHAPN
jgi:hypothetical protein